MPFDINQSLLLIVTFQFLFMGVFLLTNRKGKKVSNVLLGTLCLITTVSFGEMLLSSQGNYAALGVWSYLDLPWMLLYGPLIYAYTLSVIYRNFQFNKYQLLHFLPFTLTAILAAISYYNVPEASRTDIIERIHTYQLTPQQAMVVIPFYLHLISYITGCFHRLRQYKKVVRQDFSNLKPISLSWLSFLVRSFLAITLISLLVSIVPYTEWNYLTTYILVIDIALAFFLINQIVFKALKHPDLFSGIDDESNVRRYVGSNLSEQDKESTTSALIHYMKSQQPYLNPDLTLDSLAKNLNLRKRNVSQVINEKLGLSFFEFINKYRIDHAKALMVQRQDKNISEILYQSGFNSKSSFNAAFKKTAGMTPTEFRKTLHKKE